MIDMTNAANPFTSYYATPRSYPAKKLPPWRTVPAGRTEARGLFFLIKGIGHVVRRHLESGARHFPFGYSQRSGHIETGRGHMRTTN